MTVRIPRELQKLVRRHVHRVRRDQEQGWLFLQCAWHIIVWTSDTKSVRLTWTLCSPKSLITRWSEVWCFLIRSWQVCRSTSFACNCFRSGPWLSSSSLSESVLSWPLPPSRFGLPARASSSVVIHFCRSTSELVFKCHTWLVPFWA